MLAEKSCKVWEFRKNRCGMWTKQDGHELKLSEAERYVYKGSLNDSFSFWMSEISHTKKFFKISILESLKILGFWKIPLLVALASVPQLLFPSAGLFSLPIFSLFSPSLSVFLFSFLLFPFLTFIWTVKKRRYMFLFAKEMLGSHSYFVTVCDTEWVLGFEILLWDWSDLITAWIGKEISSLELKLSSES